MSSKERNCNKPNQSNQIMENLMNFASNFWVFSVASFYLTLVYGLVYSIVMANKEANE